MVEATLGRITGVPGVDANPAGQTATVTYDPSVTSLAELRRWVERCGYHCAGRSAPGDVPAAGSGRAPESEAVETVTQRS